MTVTTELSFILLSNVLVDNCVVGFFCVVFFLFGQKAEMKWAVASFVTDSVKES